MRHGRVQENSAGGHAGRGDGIRDLLPVAAAEAVPPPPPPAASAPKETWIPELRVGDDDAYIEVSRQINKGVLGFDDGRSTLDTPWSTMAIHRRVQGCVRLPSSRRLVPRRQSRMGMDPYSTNYVNQLNRDDIDWDSELLRKAEAYLTSERSGKLWLGQGSMASTRPPRWTFPAPRLSATRSWPIWRADRSSA